MKILSKLLIACISVMCFSCGYVSETIQKDQKSYIMFTGDLRDLTVTIDDSNPFQVKNKKNFRFEVSPGKHHIRVMRNNKVIVDRELYLGQDTNKEIKIP